MLVSYSLYTQMPEFHILFILTGKLNKSNPCSKQTVSDSDSDVMILSNSKGTVLLLKLKKVVCVQKCGHLTESVCSNRKQ